jgi:hypothetical protein
VRESADWPKVHQRGLEMLAERKQFVIVDKENCIHAIILTRNSEFYCYERFEDSPSNLKAVQEEYPDCRLVEIELKSPTKISNASEADYFNRPRG